jgi:integrative and conjugative element protein (TIGR02256 family)
LSRLWRLEVKGYLFARRDEGTVYFGPMVVQQLLRHRQIGASGQEAGGVLLGRQLLDCQDIIVDEITEPARKDRRTWGSFFRSLAHQATAFKRWRQSDGTCAYLGSWHTHPQGDPTPSGTDLSDWHHALARDRYEGDNLFFMIVGTTRVRLWQGERMGTIEEIQMTREV